MRACAQPGMQAAHLPRIGPRMLAARQAAVQACCQTCKQPDARLGKTSLLRSTHRELRCAPTNPNSTMKYWRFGTWTQHAIILFGELFDQHATLRLYGSAVCQADERTVSMPSQPLKGQKSSEGWTAPFNARTSFWTLVVCVAKAGVFS